RYAVLFSVKGAREFTLAGLAVRREAEGLINPWIYSKTTQYLPPGFLRYLLVGEYGVITMGLTLALGVVLPIVAFFFLFFALLEDSGYLARLTVLADRLFKVMGLNGRAAVPMVLGLGCDTMATLAARVLESRRARLVVTFLLALGVPCSAQLGVVMSMASAIGPMALLLIFGLVLVELFAAGYVVSRIVGNTRTDFVVEIPLLRLPTVANVLRKTWQRSEWFLREALPYFLLGTGILAVFSWVGILGLLERLFRPVVVHWLSLPPEATYAFLIGFVRRDYGAAGLFDLRYDGRLDNLQTVVALITMTLFVPCIANFLVMIKEQGLKRAVAMVAAIIPLAVLTGGAVNWVLRALGVNLG
ncbi:MAG: ferrous iron transporter B, partial [Armatimonadetes bacterium]|nr:ferrous iron transporter B [Armatimonadota bacterium]